MRSGRLDEVGQIVPTGSALRASRSQVGVQVDGEIAVDLVLCAGDGSV